MGHVEEADGAHHTVLTGDYPGWCGRWQAGELPVGQALAEVVFHHAHATTDRIHHDGFALAQRPVLYQHRRNRAATLVEPRLHARVSEAEAR